jgi:aminoglycoside 3-N-acetyltransferase
MISYREITSAFVDLQIPYDSPVIVHGSLSSFGEVRGGAETVLGAICAMSHQVMFPAFTFKTMIIPNDGPPDNGMTYGSSADLNLMAEFYNPDMPVDPLIGVLAERFRQMPKVMRSMHPILSFTAMKMDQAIQAQSLLDPFAPIEQLSNSKGWILLLGVDHTVNTSIHYAEKLAGRRQFVRWALTNDGIVECPGFPGCSDGFNVIAPMLESVTRKVTLETSLIQAIPLNFLIHAVKSAISEDPLSFLCSREDCDRCDAIRKNPVNLQPYSIQRENEE